MPPQSSQPDSAGLFESWPSLKQWPSCLWSACSVASDNMSERQSSQIKAEPVTSRQIWRARLAITEDAYKQPNTGAHLHTVYINEYSTAIYRGFWDSYTALFWDIEILNTISKCSDKTSHVLKFEHVTFRLRNSTIFFLRDEFMSNRWNPCSVYYIQGFCH